MELTSNINTNCIRWIENVSRDGVRHGIHYDAGPNAMLIQISDPAAEPPIPNNSFKEVHQFYFLDVEDATSFPDCEIQDWQAEALVELLQHALDKHMNVLVHCHAGICRSGAVVEVAKMMGFTPTDNFIRIPNLLVKHKMMKVLGWTYD